MSAPAIGHYVIIVKEARNLRAADSNGSSDPYVIVKFKGDRFRTKVFVQKFVWIFAFNVDLQQVVTRSLNPQWSGEYFEFRNVSPSDSFTFRIMDSDTPGEGSSGGDRDRKTQYTALGKLAQATRQKVSNAATRVARFVSIYFFKKIITKF
jgi:Ca2+-dependent lipid-binding protein